MASAPGTSPGRTSGSRPSCPLPSPTGSWSGSPLFRNRQIRSCPRPDHGNSESDIEWRNRRTLLVAGRSKPPHAHPAPLSVRYSGPVSPLPPAPPAPHGGLRHPGLVSVFLRGDRPGPHRDDLSGRSGPDRLGNAPLRAPPDEEIQIGSLFYRAHAEVSDTALGTVPMSFRLPATVRNPSDTPVTIEVKDCPLPGSSRRTRRPRRDERALGRARTCATPQRPKPTAGQLASA